MCWFNYIDYIERENEMDDFIEGYEDLENDYDYARVWDMYQDY